MHVCVLRVRGWYYIPGYTLGTYEAIYLVPDADHLHHNNEYGRLRAVEEENIF